MATNPTHDHFIRAADIWTAYATHKITMNERERALKPMRDALRADEQSQPPFNWAQLSARDLERGES